MPWLETLTSTGTHDSRLTIHVTRDLIKKKSGQKMTLKNIPAKQKKSRSSAHLEAPDIQQKIGMKIPGKGSKKQNILSTARSMRIDE
jgi:hypothetical protein